MSSAESSNFKRIILESNDQQKTVDLSAGVVSVDYYEDLFSPTVTAKVTVINTGDSIPGKEDDRKFQSIYNGLPLRGGERLRMYIVDRGTGKNGEDFIINVPIGTEILMDDKKTLIKFENLILKSVLFVPIVIVFKLFVFKIFFIFFDSKISLSIIAFRES